MKYILYALAFCMYQLSFASQAPIKEWYSHSNENLTPKCTITNQIVAKPFQLDFSKIRTITSVEKQDKTTEIESYQVHMKDGTLLWYMINFKGTQAGKLIVFKANNDRKDHNFVTGEFQDFVDLKVEYLKRKEQEEKNKEMEKLYGFTFIKQQNQRH